MTPLVHVSYGNRKWTACGFFSERAPGWTEQTKDALVTCLRCIVKCPKTDHLPRVITVEWKR